MKFNYVKVIITNVDEENANVKVEFDPPLPENPEDIEDQPCLTLLDDILELLNGLNDDMSAKPEYLQ